MQNLNAQLMAHEALDRCFLVGSMLDEHLQRHPHVEQTPEVAGLVMQASETVWRAYQLLGEMAADTDNHENAASPGDRLSSWFNGLDDTQHRYWLSRSRANGNGDTLVGVWDAFCRASAGMVGELLGTLRNSRDGEPDWEVRHAYNEACDRLDVLANKLDRRRDEASVADGGPPQGEDKPKHRLAEMPDGLPRVEGWDEMPAVGREVSLMGANFFLVERDMLRELSDAPPSLATKANNIELRRGEIGVLDTAFVFVSSAVEAHPRSLAAGAPPPPRSYGPPAKGRGGKIRRWA